MKNKNKCLNINLTYRKKNVPFLFYSIILEIKYSSPIEIFSYYLNVWKKRKAGGERDPWEKFLIIHEYGKMIRFYKC